MNDLTFFVSLFFGSAIAIYLLWFVCHLNGKTILYLISTVSTNLGDREPLNFFNSRVSMAAICLIGAMPLALLSISTAFLEHCFNSFRITIILEILIAILFLFIPTSVKKEFDLFGIQVFRKNSSLVIYTILWFSIFSLWATVIHLDPLDSTLSNTNPDMWAYVRRFGAMTTDNLNFYGGRDSFVFNGNSACAYLLGSPKKFSSFLGSLIIYPFQGSSLGIEVFQGMLGGTLLICLFKEWLDIKWAKAKRFSLGKTILIIWVLFSPPIYWLLISAYFSNTLFIIIICLTLKEARKISLDGKLDTRENLFCFLSILIIVFSFYPAFLPIIIAAYFGTILIYLPTHNLKNATFTRAGLKFLGIMLGCGAIFYLLFRSQFGLYEIQKSFNVLKEHGANFVPLNPWSLLQEKPKPMALSRDFGWYFNIIASLPLAMFCGWKIWQRYRQSQNKNLLAGLVGVGIYSGYLLAFIPLESTYRLMKIAISVIYPLAIFGLLSLILWWKERLNKKSGLMAKGLLVLAIAHTVFHIDAVFDLHPFPSGSLTLSNPAKLENIKSVAIVGCKDVHESQFYERLVGLQIARRYPNLLVNVFHSSENVSSSPTEDIVIYGKTVREESTKKNACHFSI
jgi:hypothetical protein